MGVRLATAVVGALIALFPVYWMLATSLRRRSEVFSRTLNLVPDAPVWSNFIAPWTELPLAQWLANSVLIASVAVLLTVPLSLLSGYALAKLRFRGRETVLIVLLSTIMIPAQVLLVPRFLLIAKAGGLNSYWAVLLPFVADAYNIFLVVQFMQTIPDDLLEAARLDGASEWTIFRRVVAPLCRPVTAVLALFTFVARWNEFAWPLVVLKDQESLTLPIGLNLLRGQYIVDWGRVMALALISVAPVVALFVLCQRYFVQGVRTSGMK